MEEFDISSFTNQSLFSQMTGAFALSNTAKEVKVISNVLGITVLEKSFSTLRPISMRIPSLSVDQGYFSLVTSFDSLNQGSEFFYLSSEMVMAKHIFYSNLHFFMKLKTGGLATILEDSYRSKIYVKRQDPADSNLYLWRAENLTY